MIMLKGVLLSVLLNKYNSGDKIKKNGTGGACDTHREEKRSI
jgi:hypothetical protein